MRNIRLLIAYEGTAYFGWQETQEGPSVEGTLRVALERLLRHPIQLQAASRTDIGVHAKGQVVNFLTKNGCWEVTRLLKALNGLLPHDLVIREVTEMPRAFHPTLDARGKEYHYHVSLGAVQLPHVRHTAWHVREPLDLLAMQQAIDVLTGEHDFRAFCNQRKGLQYRDYVRTVERFIFVSRVADQMHFEIEGENFLYKMVRNLVGTVIDIGRGKLTVAQLPFILRGGDRRNAGMTAPAHGLLLYRVRY